MPDGCFIGIDQGSSSTKALAVSTDGQVLFQTRKDLPPPFRSNDRVEHDPAEILRTVREALNETVQASGRSVLGVGLSCQRSSCLAWNERTREPLSPVISWRDLRGRPLVTELAGHAASVFSASGLPLTPYYSASKLRWLFDTLAGPARDTAVFGTLSSFLAQNLTGGEQALIDHTNAARTQLMSIRSLAWDGQLLGIFGMTGARLPDIVPAGHAFGGIATPAGEAPLFACIGDQQAAMLGLGVLERGDGGINCGTGGFLMVNTGNSLVPAEGLMASVQYSLGTDASYLLEGSVNAVGDALEWARTGLGLFTEYGQVDDLCWRAGTDTIAFIGINGTGAPHWEPDISSAFHGLTAESTNADLVRAIVENIAFFMRDIAERIALSGLRPASFALAGGLSSVTYLAQVQADLLGAPLRVSAAREASALGAAFLAGMRQGTWNAGAVKALTAGGECVEGERNPGAERRYRRWQELHRMSGELDRMQGMGSATGEE